MNRKQLLETSLTEEKNVATLVTNTITKDQKFLKKAKRDLEDLIEDTKDALEERLSSNALIDKSVVEVLYAKLKETESLLNTYKAFEKEFYTLE